MRFIDAMIWFVSGFLTGLRAFRRRLWGKPAAQREPEPTRLLLPSARRAQLVDAISETRRRAA